jgi:hypothetical protein
MFRRDVTIRWVTSSKYEYLLELPPACARCGTVRTGEWVRLQVTRQVILNFLPQLNEPIAFLCNPRRSHSAAAIHLLILGPNPTLGTGRWQLSFTRWPCCILQTFVSRLLKCEYFHNLQHSFHGKCHRMILQDTLLHILDPRLFIKM